VLLHNTRIVGSHAPIRAGEGAVIAEDSDFDSNTETAIAARIIELTRVKIRQTAGSPMEAIGGTVTLTDSDISANGRSVFDQCQLSIVRTPFTANVAETDGPAGAKGGGALFTGCTTTIENSRFVNNRSSTGGAIYIGKNAPSVIIQGSRFEGNRATNNGGAIAMEPFDAVRRTLELVYITFKNNQAKMGGAIDLGEFLENDTLLDARGVTFTANAASSQGGAIAGTNAAVQIRRGLFLRNEAQWGGAIWLHKRAVRPSVVANTLFALNKAPSGTFVGDSTRFVNVTMVGSEGPGIVVFPYGQNTGRALRLANTIVENNSGDNCRGGLPGIVDEGDNVQFPGTSCGATIREAVALLDTFYAPIIGGAARAQGNEATCAAAPVQGHDVYGEKRPQADRCSIGAVEGDVTQMLRRRRLGREPGHIPEWPLQP